MRKKILVAEQSDAIRSIAESILHQNGYDVISASNTNKAKELLISSRPNMVIIGADLKDESGNYLYDSVEDNEATASIPILLISDPDGRQLPYPDEVVLPRPFEPGDFLDKVRLFVGGGIEKQTDSVESVDPFANDSVDDEFLDSALGIDRIEVEDSEVMDKTTSLKVPRAKADEDSKEEVYGIHQPEIEEKSNDDSDKVESLMIRDDSQPIQQSDSSSTSKISGTSKLELAQDQYGLIKQDEDDHLLSPKAQKPPEDHDYDWFIKEMQKDTSKGTKSNKQTRDDQDDSDSKLEARPTSDSIEPINPPKMATEHEPAPVKPGISPGGVDQFISKFKEEIENIESRSASSTQSQAEIEARQTTAVADEPDIEKMGTGIRQEIDPDEIRHFVTHLVQILSEKLAIKIVEKINQEEIYKMIKDEIAELIVQNNIKK